MNQAQQILRIHSLNAQESHEKELSYESSTVSCCGENTQPEHCSWALPEQRDCCPELSRTQVNFSAQHWAGNHGWVAWRWHSSLWHGAVCVCASIAHPCLQPAERAGDPSTPPSPGLRLPSRVHVQKTPVEENESNEQTFRADPECLWLVDEHKAHCSRVALDDPWNFTFKGQMVKTTALLLVGRRV